MGQLVTVNQLCQGLGADWYFTEFDGNRYPVISSTFPFSLAIHNDIIAKSSYENNMVLKNRIREWVFDTVTDMVVLDVIRKDYQSYWSETQSHTERVDWGYHVFYFKVEADAVQFKLAFSEYISDILPYDPKRPITYIQSAEKELAVAKERLEKLESTADSLQPDFMTIEAIAAQLEGHLKRWDGQVQLFFDTPEGQVEMPKELFQRFKAVRALKRAELDFAQITDIHSTFKPKSRY